MDFDPRDFDSRDRDSRDIHDLRDVFSRDLDLPRGTDREIVRDRDHEYTLRGSETRTLSTVGAFRVVPASRLRDHSGRPADPRSGDLRNLREQGLVETVRIPGHRDHAVVLTKCGRELLERHRDPDQGGRQTFYAGLKRARELEHDSQVYDAYLHVAERLEEQGARIDRVVLDYELKRDYQKWLHEHDAERDDYDGHPDRDRGRDPRVGGRTMTCRTSMIRSIFRTFESSTRTSTGAAITRTSRCSPFTTAERTERLPRGRVSLATAEVRRALAEVDDRPTRASRRSC